MDFSSQLEAAIRLIDRWLAYRVYSDRLPGLAAGIVYKDKIIFSKGYGYADLKQKTATTDTTCYRIASFSKIFTAIATLQLFEQGKLHLDDHVQQHLPWCNSENSGDTALMTIRQLLTHTSGLDRDGVTPHWVDYQFPTLEAFQQHIADGALVYQPATRWKYSNMGYTLLGQVVAAVAGTTYEAHVNEYIVKRLDLTGTSPVLTEELIKRLAPGYSRDLPGEEREPFPHIEANVMASATGFTSNVRDLCQLMTTFFDGDTRLLRDETKREMRRIQWLRESPDEAWCLGFESWKINQRRLYGHGGSFQGYRSRFGIDPERQIGLVICVNAMDGLVKSLADGAFQIIDHIITQFATYEQPEHKVEHLERYEGIFRNVWGDQTCAAINDSLVLFAADSASPIYEFSRLRHEQDDQFLMFDGSGFDHIGEPVRFECDEQGVAQRIFVGANPSNRWEPENP